MANWTNIVTYDYTGSNGIGWNNEHVTIQYDKDRTTPTTTVIRFVGSGFKNLNGYYILMYPGKEDWEHLFEIKKPSQNNIATGWTTSHEYSLSKGYNSSSFTIPDFWFCCTGSATPNLNTRTITYGDYGTQTLYWYCVNVRGSWYRSFSQSYINNVPVATTGGKPTLTIKDNGDNTFTLSGKTGTNGTNNAVGTSHLYYTTNGKEPAGGSSYTTQIDITGSGTDYNKRIHIPDGCTEIWATIITPFTYGGNVYNAGNHISLSVKYYKQPSSKPGKPSLTTASYKNSRLTIKQPWTYTWVAAAKGNEHSPIKGYRIRIRKNGTLLKGLFVDSTKDSVVTIKKSTGTKEYVDTESSLTNISFDPVNLGFKASDTVYIGIYAYSRNGNGITEWVADPTYPDSAASIKHSLWSGGGTTAAEVLSDTKTVQNAGVVQIKVGSEWKEGQVWVKANNTWYEADTVNIKANGEWHESE